MADDRAEGRSARSKRETTRLVAVGVLAVVLLAFVLDNTHDVRIGFVVGDAEIPLIIVLVGTAILAAILDRLVQWTRRR